MTRIRGFLIFALILLAALSIRPAHGNPAAQPAERRAPVRFAYTQGHNVYLMNIDGSGRDVATTLGTSFGAHRAIEYPAYHWSPDGKYLLLTRTRSYSTLDVLLLDTHGNLLRTLATGLPYRGLYPTWALDGDKIAYLGPGSTMHEVDLDGRTIRTYPFKSQGYGCGGGPRGERTLSLYWGETDYDGVVPALSWSAQRHMAAISPTCSSPALIADTRTGQVGPLFNGRWNEAALSSRGLLVGTINVCPNQTPAFDYYLFPHCVWVADGRTGSRIADLGAGELPAWSPDGRDVYFVRRTPVRLLPMHGPLLGSDGEVYRLEWSIAEPVFTTSIWRAHADGSRPTRLARMDAFASGWLQVTGDGRSLIFSTVDNAWALYHHLLPGGRYTASLRATYGPRITIRRLDLASGKVTAIIRDAGRPAVRP